MLRRDRGKAVRATPAEQHSRYPATDSVSRSMSAHKPRILLLYGSLREGSYSRLVIEESARLLGQMGAETRIFDPSGLNVAQNG